jgi:PII-like signaling protein
VLLGVDGTVHGARRRARFFARNAAVPLMVIAVGDSRNIAQTIPELGSLLERPLLTLERATVCKRDGAALSEPPDLPESDPSGVPIWQKLMIYTSEQSKYNGLPVHQGLIRELRRAGASGATCLRGIWGYHGDRTPHGDSFLQLRRHVPVLTVVVDTPARVRRWFTIVDRLTSRSGLVTSEIVPAFRTPEFQAGGFRLAQRLPWSSLGGT